ncbi:hypothetical protein [Comamonas testosteroni]|uniref:hypothetical protein n=1 Tax=Comamonas testosteroni TaxID=285 RepID=UPI002DB761DE|nr:hypothetical protein [Comamonas testosteroni]MEB5964534.1 hypothetical protein [Comamonas testosteroni]
MIPGITASRIRVGGSGSAGTVFLTVPAQSEPMAGFPLTIDLSGLPGAWWGSLKHADGGDIRIEQSGVRVPVDIVAINTTAKTGFLVARVNLSGTSVSTIKVSCGDAANVLPPHTDPYGRYAVWAGYAGVWVPGISMASRAQSGGALSNSGGSAVIVDASKPFLGKAISHADARYLYASAVQSTQVWTISCTASASSSDSYFSQGAMSLNNQGSTSTRFSVASRPAKVWDAWSSSGSWMGSTAAMTLADPTRLALRSNVSTQVDLFVNGSNARTRTGYGALPTSANADFLLGATGNAGENLVGLTGGICYVFPGLRSNAWLSAESLSMKNPGGFYAITG